MVSLEVIVRSEGLSLGNLNKKDIYKLKIEDPFAKEFAEIWSDTFFEGRIASKDHFLISTSVTKFIDNALVFCNDWPTINNIKR